jgi:hydrogenase maturation protein HypF
VAAEAGRVPAAIVARRFHATVAAMVTTVVVQLGRTTGLRTVALSGGVFVNALLAEECERRLQAAGFRVLCHRLLPPNDGGLSYGQLAIAAAQDHAGPPCA